MCSVGDALREVELCTSERLYKQDFIEKSWVLLTLRSGCENITSVCALHKNNFLRDYTFLIAGKFCSNPFLLQDHVIKVDVRQVFLFLYDKWKDVQGVTKQLIVPGRKICRFCRDKLNRAVNEDLADLPFLEDVTKSDKLEVMDAIYGQELLPENVNSPPAPELSPHLPSPSPSLNVSPSIHGLQILEFQKSPSVSTTQSSNPSGGSSKPSSQERFWQTPPMAKNFKQLFEIGALLNVDMEEKRAFRSKNTCLLLLNKLTKALKNLVLECGNLEPNLEEDENPIKVPIDYEETCVEMIAQIKDKFWNSQSTEEKIKLISILPQSWSTRHVMEEMEAGRRVVERAKHLSEEQGILPSVTSNVGGKPLEKDVEEKVLNFYLDPEVSRELPGRKDVKSVKEDGKRILKQKRLFLFNLSDGFSEFKTKFPDAKIGFSKFASLRPKEVVLAGASGTHTTCVCIIHENVKLMIEGAKLHNLTDVGREENFSYKTLLDKMVCEVPTEECFFNKCKDCPGSESLRQDLQLIFDERMIEEVVYKQWTATDRSTLQTVTVDKEDFIDILLEALIPLQTHHYLVKQQAKFIREKKENLKSDEVMVVADFSQNYSFLIQNAVQGYHWSNDQATIHPFACYIRPSAEAPVEARSFVVISDCMAHKTSTVFAFQEEFIKYIKEQVPNVKKIIYVSDGSSAQYKNKYNVGNIVKHFEDYGIEVEWHFQPTAHGKGPSDGLGATVKRGAARASVLGAMITTPKELFEWAQSNIKGITFCFVSDSRVNQINSEILEERFQSVNQITGIKKMHCLIPMSSETLEMSQTSFGYGKTIVSVFKKAKSRLSNQGDKSSGQLREPQTSLNTAAFMGRSSSQGGQLSSSSLALQESSFTAANTPRSTDADEPNQPIRLRTRSQTQRKQQERASAPLTTKRRKQ